MTQGGDRTAYAQRLVAFTRQFDAADSAVGRNLKALLFGSAHRYGNPPRLPLPTLEDLERLRSRVLVPAASTLVVVGDTTPDAVRVEALRRFAGWTGQPPSPAPAAPPPAPPGPRMVVVRNRQIEQVWGFVGARGPSARDPDAAAFAVLANLLGGRAESAMFRHVREDLVAGYSVGANVDDYGDAAMIRVGGSFEHDRAIEGMRGVLDALEAARTSEPAADSLAGAKAVLIAELRRTLATDEGLAALLARAVLYGSNLQTAQDLPARIEAVTAAEVLAAAQRYLAPGLLRAAITGKAEYTAGFEVLGLGEPVQRDAFGRPVRSPEAAVATKLSP